MPDSEEAGSVLADVFLDMAAENRKRYNKIWKKQEMAFLEASPEREESRRELSGALLVRASDQGNGISHTAHIGNAAIYCMAEKAAEAILFCGGYAQGSRPVSYL